MAYSDFDLEKVTHDFALLSNQSTDLFAGVPPVTPSAELVRWLDEFAPVALGFGSELGRSSYIVAPILAEAKRRSPGRVTVIAGVSLDVDKARGLAGVCDFVLARSDDHFTLRAPIFAAVEAKREDITGGLGQCAAELVAIRLFNEKHESPVPVVYGCITSGNIWRFLKLDGDTLFIDKSEYHLSALPQILGILVSVCG